MGVKKVELHHLLYPAAIGTSRVIFFTNIKVKRKINEFLRSTLSIQIVMSCTKSQQQYFGIMLNKYEKSKLNPLKVFFFQKICPVEENMI